MPETEMKISFKIEDIPPKKYASDGMSIWGHRFEANRVVSLRKGALEKMNQIGLTACLRSHTKLELTLFTPLSKLESIGDLDNFIGGVCDGLQAAPNNAPLHEIFNSPGLEEIHPNIPLLIENDSKIVSITAKKTSEDEGQEVQAVYYIVSIEII